MLSRHPHSMTTAARGSFSISSKAWRKQSARGLFFCNLWTSPLRHRSVCSSAVAESSDRRRCALPDTTPHLQEHHPMALLAEPRGLLPSETQQGAPGEELQQLEGHPAGRFRTGSCGAPAAEGRFSSCFGAAFFASAGLGRAATASCMAASKASTWSGAAVRGCPMDCSGADGESETEGSWEDARISCILRGSSSPAGDSASAGCACEIIGSS